MSGPEHPTRHALSPAPLRTLRCLSYNVQAGIATSRYRHYLTHSWRHFIPHPGRRENLDRIAAAGLHQFDVVGLQEIDAGSLRTSYINQARYLAERAEFPYWHFQTNRNMGQLARHSNGLLSRLRPCEITDYKLPGLPGRGALLTRFGPSAGGLLIVVAHLALSRRARHRQLAFLSELLDGQRRVVVMGDFNCAAEDPEMRFFTTRTGLNLPAGDLHTYPSWRPNRRLDHILVSVDLTVDAAYVPAWAISDHLPVAVDLRIPADAAPEVSPASFVPEGGLARIQPSPPLGRTR